MEWCLDSSPLLSKELQEDLTSVSRNSDPVMTIELGLEECACAPQVGCIIHIE